MRNNANPFWRFANMEASAKDKPALYIEGYIYPEEPWWMEDGTLCAPESFRRQLAELEGEDIDIWVHSRGGDAAAGAAIFAYLDDRKGSNTFKVPALAASAATLPLMARGTVCVGTASLLMIHNPLVSVTGDHVELSRAQNYLFKLKDAVINAYMHKSKKSREEISAEMDKESWYTAQQAIDAKYADEIMSLNQNGLAAEMCYTRSSIMEATMDATGKMMNAHLQGSEKEAREAIFRYLETY